MSDAPDSMQTLWLIRGGIFGTAGMIALIGAFFAADWPYYMLAALAGLGLGCLDIWLAVSSMEADRVKRLAAPARVESAGQGLADAGWNVAPTSRRSRDANASGSEVE